jgi:hypothetical protein
MQANRQWLSTDFALSTLWLPGPVSWLLLNRWRVTWRGDGQITANSSAADDCSERPASLTLTCELTKLWYFPVSCKNCVKSFGCYSVQLHPRCATVSDTKLRSFFLTSRAVFLFRHAHSLLFCFHDCDWPQAFQPSYTIPYFLLSITSAATEI